MSSKSNLLYRVLWKFHFAINGLINGLRYDSSIQIQVLFAAIALSIAYIFRFTQIEFVILTICIGFVLSFEYLNSALEAMLDRLQPNVHPLAKQAKDLGSASVGISALISLIVGLIFLFNHL
ncbi:MAG: diacylglycerol kinase [Erysipelotrichaceae bacterium]